MKDSLNKKTENNLSNELLRDDLELSIMPQKNDEWLPSSNQKQRDYGQEESDENEGWEELVDEWLVKSEELKLTEDQMELNSKLLQSLRRLGFDVGERFYSYTGAPVLEEFLGSVNKISCKPYKSSNEIQKSQISHSSLIKPGKNPSEVFDFTEKTLNQMPLFINMFVIIPLHFSIPFRRNHNFALFILKTGNKSIAIIAFISHYSGVSNVLVSA